MIASWNWKSCITGAIFAASVLASTSAHAQLFATGPVSRTEAGVEISRGDASAARLRKMTPVSVEWEDRCKIIQQAVGELWLLASLQVRAQRNGEAELAALLQRAGERLDDAIEEFFEEDDAPCRPQSFTMPGGGGGGGGGASGGGGGQPRGFWFGFQFSEVRLGLNWSRSQQGNGNNQFNPFNPFPNDNLPNSGSATQDPFGGGVSFGYAFTPWSRVQVSPFVSFDYLNMSVAQTFPGGSLVGTTSNFETTAGVKAGPRLSNGLWLYGIAGASLLSEKLNVVIAPLSSSTRVTVPGATVGVGGAIRPSFLQGYGRPVSVFAEYQHTWWQDANFMTPTASPFFNYNFRRQDDVVKFGFTVSLASLAPPASTPSYPVKALPSK